MRPIPILIMLGCGTVLAQESTTPLPITPTPHIYENLRQHLGDMFKSQQLRASGKPPVTEPLRITAVPPASRVCSIPLLNATAPGKPVPMPNTMPHNNLLPGPNSSAPRTTPAPSNKPPIDRMEVVAPAPPCPADFAQSVGPVAPATPRAPAPATPPAVTPEPAPPAKP